MSKELEVAIKSAKSAGRILTDNFYKVKSVHEKSPGELVTNVDIESEKKIKEILKMEFPSYNIVSEESENEEFNSDYTWYIDPLDGTHNYINSVPFFSVSIALSYKKEVIMGVVYFPLMQELFFAEKNKGAYLNYEKINAPETNKVKSGILLSRSSLLTNKRLLNIIERLNYQSYKLRVLGSCAINLCYIASGRADIFVDEGSQPYDFAAGCLIVNESGGNVIDFNGNKWDVNSKNLIASNKGLREVIIKDSKDLRKY